MSLVVHCMTRLVYEYGKNEDNSFHEPIGILSGTGDETEGTLVDLELNSDDDISSCGNANSDPIADRGDTSRLLRNALPRGFSWASDPSHVRVPVHTYAVSLFQLYRRDDPGRLRVRWGRERKCG